MSKSPCVHTCVNKGRKELSQPSEKAHQLPDVDAPLDPGRRSFLAKAGAAATVTMATGAIALTTPSTAQAEVGPLSDSARAQAAFNLRQSVAQTELNQPLVSHCDNGDESLYPDKCGSFTKCLPHDSFGRVNLSAYQSLITALTTGNPTDFANITMGGTNLLTNPQSGLAFDLEGMDPHNLTVPPAPAVASPQMATEMVELYWASLLRDVPFGQYS